MKIVSVETFSTTHISVVRVTADDGSVGYGQVAPYNADITAMVVHRQVAPYFLGSDPADIDTLVDRCIVGQHKFPGSYVCRAAGGVDTALWDLLAKQQGKSVCAMLGGTKKRLTVYGSSMQRDIRPEAEAGRLVRLQQENGFSAFKIRIANNFGNDIDRWPGRTEAIVPTVRKAIGDKTLLLVDANSGYTPKRAIEVGRMLEQYNVGHFEEPCPYQELEWTAEVAAALSVPVSGGEQECDLAQFRRMARLRAVDIMQPDVCYIGGISRARAAASIAETAGLPCTPHAANRTMVTVFTLHLQGALPNAGPYMELSIEEAPWLEGLFVGDPFKVVDGRVDIPEGPGWGVEINPEWLAKADHMVSSL
ncbi:L-alanine-DL-glutamate epimerase-like enolase superfamily enzyme [Phyllobacterium trifolii]|uniref:L-alanine-DL-glutamate epimerase-like enolase superfamily enzyme n=1 Tax=Phyllobacterium trifolii TaxID=300193 RepID=A0A839UG11_9HYPH|nr:mandelate racemase/muconate lactonizing enzyme family protein [Phyllobacterium trifolii]MBB3149497.1 L-alanine-DL-glutamate epimerase-like enolase superfamily enzyme [Phyllobacterium trifolii]